MIKLGVVVEDVITGFSGRVTGLVEYLSGCDQALVTSRFRRGGSAIDERWINTDRLAVIDTNVLELPRLPRRFK